MEGTSSGEGPLGVSRHALDERLVQVVQGTRSILAGQCPVPDVDGCAGGCADGGVDVEVDAVLRLLVQSAREVLAAEDAEFVTAATATASPAPAGSLVVPVTVSDELFGQLQVSRFADAGFGETDVQLVSMLAAAAGIALEKVRLRQEQRQRRDWLATAAEVTRTLLAEPSLDPLDLIVCRVRELADADLVAIVLRADDGARLRVAAAAGAHADDLRGATCPIRPTATEGVLERSTAFRSPCVELGAYGDRALLEVDGDVGPAIALPLVGARRSPGVLWAVRASGRLPFTELDERMVAAFAEQVSIAWQVADAREVRVRSELIEDRSRIARDLHDHVIQRLFAAGLTLHAVAPRAGDVGDRIAGVVDELDAVIKQIRGSIFELTPASGGLRAAALRVLDDCGASLGFAPHVAFDGPVDTRATGELVNDVTAVLREALTNVAKHAGATSADVVVRADRDAVEVRVTDNGRGLANPERMSGLRNMRERAEARSGSLMVEPSPAGSGVSLAWRVPVPRRKRMP